MFGRECGDGVMRGGQKMRGEFVNERMRKREHTVRKG